MYIKIGNAWAKKTESRFLNIEVSKTVYHDSSFICYIQKVGYDIKYSLWDLLLWFELLKWFAYHCVVSVEMGNFKGMLLWSSVVK